MQRRSRVQQSALLLEEAYKAEREARVLIPEPTSRPELQGNALAAESGNVENGTQTALNVPADEPPKRERMLTPPTSPLPPPETKPWSPKTARRG